MRETGLPAQSPKGSGERALVKAGEEAGTIKIPGYLTFSNLLPGVPQTGHLSGGVPSWV